MVISPVSGGCESVGEKLVGACEEALPLGQERGHVSAVEHLQLRSGDAGVKVFGHRRGQTCRAVRAGSAWGP